MRRIFLDTLYIVARLNPPDQWHQRAREVMAAITNAHFVTTESVLVEVLNFFAAYQPTMRQTAAEFVRDALDSADLQVVPHTREAFLSGLELCESRLDKGYSLTDCISIERTLQNHH